MLPGAGNFLKIGEIFSVQRDEDGSCARNQYLAAFVASIMVFCQGCEIGWVSPVLSTLSNPNTTPLDEPLTTSQASLVGSLLCLGAFLATPFFGWTLDRYGRKATGLASAVPCIIAWFLKLVGSSGATLMAARFLAGVAGGAIYVTTATYLVEVATPRTRGALGSLMILAMNLGTLSMYVMGACFGYRVVSALVLALPVFYLALMWRMPETPVFLVKNGRDEQAAKTIAWLRMTPEDHVVVRNELEALKFDIDLAKYTQSGAPHSWRYLFFVESSFKAFLVCFALFSAQSFVGIFAVLTFANAIFEDAGTTLSPNANAIVIGLLQFIGSVVASTLIERAGRKILLISSCLASAICMLAIGIYFYENESGKEVSSINWIPVVALSIVVATFSIGLGPIPFILLNEMIPVQARALANIIVLSWVWLSAFCVGQITFFAQLLGLYTVFWFFSASALFGIFVTIYFLPETKGETLEKIIAYYAKNESLCEDFSSSERGSLRTSLSYVFYNSNGSIDSRSNDGGRF